jgi:copper chaperone
MLSNMLVLATFSIAAATADLPKPVEAAKAPAKTACKCGQAEQPVKTEQPAKSEAKTTKLTVDGMTCAGCAKSVTKALTAVEGVESVVIDLKAKTATVTPKAGKAPSQKALWEAVEKAEYKPTKIEGPDGTSEKKPTK